MQQNQPSRTAEATAFQRATERQRPARQRIVDDPWAEHFLRPGLRAALAAYRSSVVLKGVDDLFGLTPFVVTRHRYIDDRLDAALRAGVEQVVVLGVPTDVVGRVRAERDDRLAARPEQRQHAFHQLSGGSRAAQRERRLDVGYDNHVALAAVVGEHDLSVDLELEALTGGVVGDGGHDSTPAETWRLR